MAIATLTVIFCITVTRAEETQPIGTGGSGKPYNIVFVISDQRAYRLFAEEGYSLPALEDIARHGVTFTNHYIASAMCSPSRAALLTGRPPQVNGVIDQMQTPYTPSLSPRVPNLGSVLKGLGYKTAYFGKFEMDKALLKPDPAIDYSGALQSYGFDVFSAGGDIGSAPQSGLNSDPLIARESANWLRTSATEARRGGKPFFMVASFLNPHDIMFGNANVPGESAAEEAVSPKALPPLPASSIYDKTWSFSLPPSLDESLTAPGTPAALLEYKKGWDGWSGAIPADRKDMWRIFYNYYLNAIRDEDRSLQQIVDVMNEMDLWQDTVFVFTSDHGEMAGAHGGQKGKGPFIYEANAHVPLLIASPAGKKAAASAALTSHLDLLPTFVGLTGLPPAIRPPAMRDLPGHDISILLADPESSHAQSPRSAVLFNYAGVMTVDGDYLSAIMASPYLGRPAPPIDQIKFGKRGFVSFVFDGRYKFGRYYAPSDFNTPQTLEEIFRHNDVQLFDLESDPEEVHNLAAESEKNSALILRMNGLLNDLIAKEVGFNDDRFLPDSIRTKQ
ncbi:MAG: sulfatase-like hydrolase/transferase [Hyphomicrobiales bacterium]